MGWRCIKRRPLAEQWDLEALARPCRAFPIHDSSQTGAAKVFCWKDPASWEEMSLACWLLVPRVIPRGVQGWWTSASPLPLQRDARKPFCWGAYVSEISWQVTPTNPRSRKDTWLKGPHLPPPKHRIDQKKTLHGLRTFSVLHRCDILAQQLLFKRLPSLW